MVAAAAPAEALALVHTSLGSLPVNQHPPAPAATPSVVRASSSWCQGPGGEGVEGHILPAPGASIVTLVLCSLETSVPVPAVASSAPSLAVPVPVQPAVAAAPREAVSSPPKGSIRTVLAGRSSEGVPAAEGQLGGLLLGPHLAGQHGASGHQLGAVLQVAGPAASHVAVSSTVVASTHQQVGQLTLEPIQPDDLCVTGVGQHH